AASRSRARSQRAKSRVPQRARSTARPLAVEHDSNAGRPPIPDEVAVAVDAMLKKARGYVVSVGQVDPEWGAAKRRVHLDAAIKLVAGATTTLQPFGGSAAEALKKEARAITTLRGETEAMFHGPVGKVPGRSPAVARFFARVRDLRLDGLRGIMLLGDGDDAGTVAAVWDALGIIVRGLDDVDRCIIAGKPARLALHVGMVEVRPGSAPPR